MEMLMINYEKFMLNINKTVKNDDNKMMYIL
jgi:hypothetical protein